MAQIPTVNNGAYTEGQYVGGANKVPAFYTEVGTGLRNLSGTTLKANTPCRITVIGGVWGFVPSGGPSWVAAAGEEGRVDGFLFNKVCDNGEVGVLYINFQAGDVLTTPATAKKKLYLSDSVLGGYQDSPAFAGHPALGVTTGAKSVFFYDGSNL